MRRLRLLNSQSLIGVLAVALLGISASAAIQTQKERYDQPNYQKAADEALGYLAEYLRVDTTNPPGNERLGAEYLAAILNKNGIEAQLYDAAPGRAVVYARLKGTGKKKAVILLNHIDVVPAVARDWKHPPFSGEVHEGELWGRGALDMKGMGIAQLEAMLLLKRQGVKLDRDVIFLGTPDEEVGGIYGAKWFTEEHPELIKDAEFLINEGSHIITAEDGKPKFWGVNFSEKSVLWLKLTATGAAGHASMPIKESAPNKLSRALNKIVARFPKNIQTKEAVDELQRIADSKPEPLKSYYLSAVKNAKSPEYLKSIQNDKMLSSMLVNTVSLTVMKSGYKTNVIPAEAVAELDCRLLPGVERDEFIQEVKAAAADPSIDVSVLEWETPGVSSLANDMMSAIKTVAKEEAPGVAVTPVVVPWFTDSHWFRKLGITCYGFEPMEVKPDLLASMHGKDERVPLKVYCDGLRRLHKIILTLAAQN